jgi:hypothetical protein
VPANLCINDNLFWRKFKEGVEQMEKQIDLRINEGPGIGDEVVLRELQQLG